VQLPHRVETRPEASDGGAGETPDDAALVARAATGDSAAIAQIWERHHSLVRSVLYATLGIDQEIEDLTQEVFLEFLRAVKAVRDGTALPAILSRIAVRRAGMALRRRRVRSVILSLPWADVPEIPVAPADLDGRNALVSLYRLLDRIKSRHRLAFLLHNVRGMDVAEVADAMALSVSATKRAIGAGRKMVLLLARRDPRLSEFLSGGGTH
jgi:RNA polymerase sigma-70 factor (ECF subfamily)